MLIFRKESDGVPVEEDLAAAVTELANAYQVLMEGGYDLEVAGGKGGKDEVGGRGRGVDAAGVISDVGCVSVQVDVADGAGWSDVYVTGACVGDGCVGDRNDSRGGGDTARRGGNTTRNIS